MRGKASRTRMASTVLLGIGLLLLPACASVQESKVVVRSLSAPASLSRAVFDRMGNVVVTSTEDRVGQVHLEWRSWSMLWNLVPLTPTERDVSADLEAAIRKHGGNAVVNLRVTGRDHWYSFLTAFLPIVPGYVSVEVDADVVNVPGY